MMLTLYSHFHHLAAHPAPPLGNTESDWIRRIGVFIGLTGAVIAAWNGTTWLARMIRDFVTKWWRRAQGQLAYLWLRLRRKPTARHVALPDAATATAASFAPQMTASGLVWRPGASADEKAEILHEEILKIHRRINELDQTVRNNHTEVKALVEGQISEVREAHRKLEELLAAKERHETRVDGRGLLLVAAGILLTGLPDELACYAAFGWAVTILAVCFTVAIIPAVFRDSG